MWNRKLEKMFKVSKHVSILYLKEFIRSRNLVNDISTGIKGKLEINFKVLQPLTVVYLRTSIATQAIIWRGRGTVCFPSLLSFSYIFDNGPLSSKQNLHISIKRRVFARSSIFSVYEFRINTYFMRILSKNLQMTL